MRDAHKVDANCAYVTVQMRIILHLSYEINTSFQYGALKKTHLFCDLELQHWILTANLRRRHDLPTPEYPISKS